MSDLFIYRSPEWFSIVANLSILVCIVAVAAFIAFAVYGEVKARITAAEDVNRMLTGLDKLDPAPKSMFAKGSRSPFGPRKHRKQKDNDNEPGSSVAATVTTMTII